MNILVLIKPGEIDQVLWDYAKGLHQTVGARLHVLNIVGVNGEVPVKKDGQVLDFCTEFDLTPYHNESGANRRGIKQLMGETQVESFEAQVGNPEQIIAHTIQEKGIDLILSGAKVTSNTEDIFTSNFAENLLEKTEVPFLTLKCERNVKDIKNIGHIGDFSNPGKRDLRLIEALRKNLGAKLTLIRINTPNNVMDTADIERNMQEFMEINGLEQVETKVVSAQDATTGVQDLVIRENLDMILLGHMKRNAVLSFLNGDMKAEILNKTEAPIYIY